jgi:cytoskeleton protein RodZ
MAGSPLRIAERPKTSAGCAMKTMSGVAASAAFDCDVCGARLDAAHLDHAADGSHCTFCGAPQAETPAAAADGEAVQSPSLDVGDALHDARVTLGETLEQASHFTRIQLPYLRALEHDDASVFEPFPGLAYARYFLRDYAEHLGIDPGPLMRRFDSEITSPVVLPASRPLRPRRQPRTRRWAVGAFVVLLALLAGSAVWSRTHAEAPAVTARSSAPSDTADRPQQPEQAPPRTTASTPPRATSILAVIRTTTRPSWVQANVNGSVAEEATVPAGTVLRFRATRTFELRLGDAGAVVLTVNGEHVPTGTGGAVADLSFALQHGRVIRR